MAERLLDLGVWRADLADGYILRMADCFLLSHFWRLPFLSRVGRALIFSSLVTASQNLVGFALLVNGMLERDGEELACLHSYLVLSGIEVT